MISNKVNATILGTLKENILYSGYANGEDLKNMPAYIITRSGGIQDNLSAVVVAVITLHNSNEERLVLAPEGEIFYEPEILDILHNLKSLNIASIKCLYEKSCGAVIFYKSKKGIKILLVKNNNGRYWSFPKGHIEKGELEEETAVREIKEETDLDIQIIDGFREISDYCPFGKIRKRVVFFLAQAFTDNVKIQESEIDSYIWVDLQQARKKCSYNNDLRVLDKAEMFITQQLK